MTRGISPTVSFMVGDGSPIRFWHDVCCREAALKSIFPDLYSIAHDKEAMVLDYLDSSGISFHWNPRFTWAV
jgi:hypothetical protein